MTAGAHALRELKAVHDRHVDVSEHDIDARVRAEKLEGILPVPAFPRDVDAMPGPVAERSDRQEHERLIVDDEDLGHWPASRSSVDRSSAYRSRGSDGSRIGSVIDTTVPSPG